MRVIIAGDYPARPPDVVGGIQAVIYYTLERLADYHDLELHVVTCEKWRVPPADRPGPERWRVHYLSSPRRIPHTLSMLTLDRWRVARALRALAPDVIHAHGQVAAYPWAAFDHGAPVVVTVHGISALEAQIDFRGGAWRGGLRTRIWSAVERACLRRARDVIVISPFVAQAIAPYTHARLYAIENPVRDSFFRLRREAAGATEERRILYVGTIRRCKGLAELIQALHDLRDLDPPARLRVAGDAQSVYVEYDRQIRRLTAELGLTDRVDFLGHLDQSALLAEYRTCAVFCLPSYLESSPVVVAEAMAAACPVVTTAIDSTAHLIVDGETGYRVPPGDPVALAERLRAVLSDPGQARVLGEAAREVAAARFRPEMAAAATYRAYLQIAAEG